MIKDKDELKTRIEAKRAELEARLKSAKADAQGTSRETVEAIERKLASLRDTIKGGWDDLSSTALCKLNDFLRDN